MYDSQDQRATKQQLEEARQLMVKLFPSMRVTDKGAVECVIATAQVIATNRVARTLWNLPS